MVREHERIVGIIPARYESKRLPGKVLLDLKGLPIIIHVLKRAEMSSVLSAVYVATDSERIAACVRSYGGEVIMTSSEHETGTDRINEAAQAVDADIIVDIQGDEPFFNPLHVAQIIKPMLLDPTIDLVIPILPLGDPFCRSEVKVVFSPENKVLYLSREPIPSNFKKEHRNYYRHYSIIPFKKKALNRFASMPQSSLEQLESIELLRALEGGMNIGTVKLEGDAISIDTQEDYAKAQELIRHDAFVASYIHGAGIK